MLSTGNNTKLEDLSSSRPEAYQEEQATYTACKWNSSERVQSETPNDLASKDPSAMREIVVMTGREDLEENRLPAEDGDDM